jgi:hypothetical protein
MSSSKQIFQNTGKWDGKDDVRTQHDWNTNSWSRFVAPRAPISEEKSKITNGAAARWKRRKKERERREEEEQRHLGGLVTLNGLVWLSHAMSGGVTPMAWLRPHGGYCAMVEPSHASANGVTSSWVTPTKLVWLKRAKFGKSFGQVHFLNFK